MKMIAISAVLAVLATSLYVMDRKTAAIRTVNVADSLDSVQSIHLHYSVDSLMNESDKHFNARLIQLKRHIDFQDRVILRLSKRIDSLAHPPLGIITTLN